VLSDNVHIAYLCDVYVLFGYRGRGLGVELVLETVDAGPQRKLRRWLGTWTPKAYTAASDSRLPDLST
jgi:GNAT superfamily N-acetyltransferase